ncbi:bifunctional phosphopantothenoylcysteine decarboxylase/phosphopantothenate--cysteine ligase CoaBC [Burkholderiaceae bacterium FT117]|uniref:bifunctional phosphopantothenoylcysteine decarboxylase/phosphopantothenate--cysteine ligase CoaBC n=1 Tax=Zeimonas sediminis TaxID=2944268 RepID=UPI002342F0F2|nr:bifunctional phosphopantothenoylcysteine decarboxylase/phosphopantothenate--cysteine ligase CoaBC [Zeimonas sediminis]MCM5572256.1 bifunctional phosphopantothenoylcysteine decarboxylase/phosphopantothenate--cysteine ligase CoaBC [Zeimonas sediminis]
MKLEGKRILLGVTGGVAAFKAAFLARELQRRGAAVQVAMTEAATHFVGTATFQALTGQPVFTDQWDTRIDNGMAHIELSRAADALLVAPASADFLAKLANGLCDDLLSTLCLARDCPLVVAPAMNRQMWAHPATQRNVARLRDDGVSFFGPDSGDQACGETGEGRMLEAEDLAEAMEAFFVPKRLAGRRVLLTAGPTFEPIDPVRGITNLSSGRMGFAIARACRQAGAEAVLVAGPTALPTPMGVTRIDVTTAEQMHRAVMRELDAGRFDVFVAVAAVADWRVANRSASKLKKTDGGGPPALEFAQNPDILAEVARRPDAPWCVGFAAESEDLEANGAAKREKKGVPLLVGNIGHETFGRDENELLLIDAAGSRKLPRASKDALAAELVAEIATRLPKARA